jgi:hypothetical protein
MVASLKQVELLVRKMVEQKVLLQIVLLLEIQKVRDIQFPQSRHVVPKFLV